MSLFVNKQSDRTLEALVAAIRSCEQQAAKKRIVRDRLLGQAREAALEVAALAEQATGLREVLGGLGKEVFERAFGEPFTGDEIQGRVEPSSEQLLAGTRDLLAFLEATPDVAAAHEYWGIKLPQCESDAERIAAVDAIAVVLGEEPKRRPHYSGDTKEQYGIQRMFGPVKLYADVIVDRNPDPVNVGQAHAQHVESDAERGICRNCGASTADGHCSNPRLGGGVLDEQMLGMGAAVVSA